VGILIFIGWSYNIELGTPMKCQKQLIETFERANTAIKTMPAIFIRKCVLMSVFVLPKVSISCF